MFELYLITLIIKYSSQGAVNPTHYMVIYDRGGIKADLLQQLAYSTTFMYFNWCGAIRVPAMIQVCSLKLKFYNFLDFGVLLNVLNSYRLCLYVVCSQAICTCWTTSSRNPIKPHGQTAVLSVARLFILNN